MKLVNPNFLGFEVEYKFVGIELDCKDFNDLYTHCTYSESGCYGCSFLKIGFWKNLSCDKGHNIHLCTVRKNENNEIMDYCPEFQSVRQRYGKSACYGCDNRYFSIRLKCKRNYNVREEIIRM